MTTVLRRIAGAAVVFLSLATAVGAQEVKLIFATTVTNTPNTQAFLGPWVQRVNELGKGAIVVEERDGPNLATMGNSYDRVMNDVVQIAWGLQPLLGGKFPLSEVAGLPFLADDCEDGAVALWRMYKTGMLDDEYKDIVPLWLAISFPNSLHFAKPPRSPVDLKGLKVNVFNRILVQVVQQFGGTPVSIPPEQQYEALQRGVMDATLTAWSGVDSYKLYEVTTYHTQASLGSSVHMFFMSRKKFDSLPTAAQKALLDASGERQSRFNGKIWDGLEKTIVERAAKTGKQQIYYPTLGDIEDWKSKTAPIMDEWARSRPHGEEVLARYRELLAEVAAEDKKQTP